MQSDSKRYAMVCSRCGSDDVSRDAWADWDTDEQKWVLGATYDHTFCHKCEGETHAIEVELAPQV